MAAAYTASTLIALLDRLGVSRKGRELRTACRLCGHNSLFINPGRVRPVLVSCGHCGKEKQNEVLAAAAITSADLGPQLPIDEIKDIWAEANPDAIVDGDDRTRIASADVRNAVYGWLLRRPECSLSDAHADWLRERGLDPAIAKAIGYGSTPDDISAAKIAAAAFEVWGQQLYTVPGFYEFGGKPALAVKDQGIWHPVYDVDGMLVALKVRRPKATKDYRMSTLSASKFGGPIAAAEVHAPLGSISKDGNETIVVTEGERKAEVLFRHFKLPTLGLPGVQHVSRLPALLDRLKCRKVIAAFDADAAGELATGKLVEAIWRDGERFDLKFAQWEVGEKPSKDSDEERTAEEVKAYRPKADDAICAGVPIEIVGGDDPRIQALLRRGSDVSEATAAVTVRRGSLGITANELLGMEFPPKRFCVEGMVGEGLNLLFGPPKSGKTILGFQMAICVATGRPFLGHRTNQSHVLYIALEDTVRMIQDRLRKMGFSKDQEPGFDLLRFETLDTWLKYRGKQLPVLKRYLEEMNGDVGLVVVDTLQRWRNLEEDLAVESTYANDSRFMESLWRLGGETRTPLWFNHHSRKAATGDHIADASGTNGIVGSCDQVTMFTRKPHCSHCYLASNGRIVDEWKKWVFWNQQDRWFYPVEEGDVPDGAKVGEATDEEGRGPTIAMLLTHLILRHGGGTQAALTAEVMKEKPKIKPASVAMTLTKLKTDGILLCEGRGDTALWFPAAGKVHRK